MNVPTTPLIARAPARREPELSCTGLPDSRVESRLGRDGRVYWGFFEAIKAFTDQNDCPCGGDHPDAYHFTPDSED